MDRRFFFHAWFSLLTVSVWQAFIGVVEERTTRLPPKLVLHQGLPRSLILKYERITDRTIEERRGASCIKEKKRLTTFTSLSDVYYRYASANRPTLLAYTSTAASPLSSSAYTLFEYSLRKPYQFGFWESRRGPSRAWKYAALRFSTRWHKQDPLIRKSVLLEMLPSSASLRFALTFSPGLGALYRIHYGGGLPGSFSGHLVWFLPPPFHGFFPFFYGVPSCFTALVLGVLLLSGGPVIVLFEIVVREERR